jgi:hypothetical protein
MTKDLFQLALNVTDPYEDHQYSCIKSQRVQDIQELQTHRLPADWKAGLLIG